MRIVNEVIILPCVERIIVRKDVIHLIKVFVWPYLARVTHVFAVNQPENREKV